MSSKPVVGFYDDLARDDSLVIPTGWFDLDYGLLGRGGFPIGRVVEIFGPQSGGKSYLGYTLLRGGQKLGLNVGLADVECSVSGKETGGAWLKKIGVDTSKLAYLRNIFLEDVARTAIEWMNSGVRVVLIDSVGGMSTRYQHDRIWGKTDKDGTTSGQHDFGDQRTGHFAGVLTDAVKEIRMAADLTNSLVIILNQVRDNIGAEKWEDDETTPGGRALLHESSLRLRVSRVAGKDGVIIEDGDVVGNYARVYVAKSRVSPPYRRTGEHTPSHLAIFYDGRELDEATSLTVHAAHLGIVTRAGSWYSYEVAPDIVIKAQGIVPFSEQLREHLRDPELLTTLRDSVIAATRDKMSISEVETIGGFEGLDDE